MKAGEVRSPVFLFITRLFFKKNGIYLAYNFSNIACNVL